MTCGIFSHAYLPPMYSLLKYLLRSLAHCGAVCRRAGNKRTNNKKQNKKEKKKKEFLDPTPPQNKKGTGNSSSNTEKIKSISVYTALESFTANEKEWGRLICAPWRSAKTCEHMAFSEKSRARKNRESTLSRTGEEKYGTDTCAHACAGVPHTGRGAKGRHTLPSSVVASEWPSCSVLFLSALMRCITNALTYYLANRRENIVPRDTTRGKESPGPEYRPPDSYAGLTPLLSLNFHSCFLYSMPLS